MEGIVKQASDSHYWDLWNHQKLSSEFELKRRHILQMNQVYQLFFFRHRLVRPEVQFFFFATCPRI
jgi:hypothetical protein